MRSARPPAASCSRCSNIYGGIFAQYANFGWAPSASDPAPADRPLLDRWMLSRLTTVEQEADALLGAFDATAAARLLIGLRGRRRLQLVRAAQPRALLRRGRRRTTAPRSPRCTRCWWWSCRLLAPFAPFITDWMHRALTGESVHLARVHAGRRAAGAIRCWRRAMAEVRELARLGRAAREEAGIRVRQPLARCCAWCRRPRRGDRGAAAAASRRS